MTGRWASAVMTVALLLGMLPAAAPSTDPPTFASDLPERLDLYFKPTTAGTVAVLSWQQPDGLNQPIYADSNPSTPVLDVDISGIVKTDSVTRVIATANALAAAQITGGANAHAALIDEVFNETTGAVVATQCCAPHDTLHLHEPLVRTDPVALYTTRNGTHEWSPGAAAPDIPLVEMTLTLGKAGLAGGANAIDASTLDAGLTGDRRNALRLAIAELAHVSVDKVTAHDVASTTHVWTPSIEITNLAHSWVDDTAARREVVRDAFASAAGLSASSVAMTSLTEAAGSTEGTPKMRAEFTVTIVGSDAADAVKTSNARIR